VAWSLSLPRHKPYPRLYNDTNASSATTAEVAAIEKPGLPAPDVEEAEGLAAGVEVVAGVVVAAELPPPGCGITVPLDLPWIALPVVVAGIDPMNEPETDKPRLLTLRLRNHRLRSEEHLLAQAQVESPKRLVRL